MKNIKIIFTFALFLVLASCGYNLANKPVAGTKNRDYPKKVDYTQKTIEVETVEQSEGVEDGATEEVATEVAKKGVKK